MNNKSRLFKLFYSRFRNVLAFGLMAVLIASCSDVNFSGSKAEKGHMDFHLTDAPANYDEVNIDVQGLRIHYTPQSSDTVTSDTTSSDGKWIDLPLDPVRLNLLELTNGVDSLIASADLDAGHYKELRLILGDDNDVVIDGETHSLKVPSGQESGYKIKFSTDLEPGDDIDVTIDFDAARSVHKAGNSEKYILKPVLKAFISGGADMETGSIAGNVEPLDAEATVYAIMGADTSSTQPDTTGAFTLVGLNAGSYDLNIQPANDLYRDTTLTGIPVTAGEENNLGTITLSEN